MLPIDTWVRRLAVKIGIVQHYSATDAQIRKSIVETSDVYDFSPLKLNQGMYYIGAWALETLLENLEQINTRGDPPSSIIIQLPYLECFQTGETTKKEIFTLNFPDGEELEVIWPPKKKAYKVAVDASLDKGMPPKSRIVNTDGYLVRNKLI